MTEETVEEKWGPLELYQLPTSVTAFTGQLRKGKAYLHLKFNLAKACKQEASPNFTQRYGNLEDLPIIVCSIDRATTASCCCNASRSRYTKNGRI